MATYRKLRPDTTAKLDNIFIKSSITSGAAPHESLEIHREILRLFINKIFKVLVLWLQLNVSGEFERSEMERKPLLEKEFERYSIQKLFKIN